MKDKQIIDKATGKAVSIVRIVVDLGNSLLKGCSLSIPTSPMVEPHAVSIISKARFDQLKERYAKGYNRMQDRDFSTFAYRYKNKSGEWETIYAVVGKPAENMTPDSRRAGGVKYERDYYPLLLMRVLLNFLPDGHPNIGLTVGYPSGDIRYKDTLINSVSGTHHVELVNGDKVKFTIREVLPYDESVGGVRHWSLAPDGIHYQRPMEEFDGLMGLCVDIGGAISSLTPFDPMTGWVDYNNTVSIGMGIQSIMQNISDILLTDHADKFRNHRDGTLAFDAIMRRAIDTGEYWNAGEYLQIQGIVDESTALFRRTLQQELDKTGGTRSYGLLAVSGGGGGAMHNQFIIHDTFQYNKNRIYTTEPDIEKIHCANMWGAAKITSAHIYTETNVNSPAQGGKLLKRRR